MARAAGSTSRKCRFRHCHIGRIDKHSHTSGCGHQLAQELQPFRHQLSRENIDPRQVAAGLGEAGDKTEPDRVFTGDEDYGDRRGSRLSCERRRLTFGCDNRDPPAN